MIAQHEAIGRYVHAILQDGDYLNDWLTYVATYLQPIVLTFGHLLAVAVGR